MFKTVNANNHKHFLFSIMANLSGIAAASIRAVKARKPIVSRAALVLVNLIN